MLTLRAHHRTTLFRAFIHGCALAMSVTGLLPFVSPIAAGQPAMLTTASTLRGAVPVRAPSRGPSIADAVFSALSVGESRQKFLKDLAWMPAVRPPVALGGGAAEASRASVSAHRKASRRVASPVLRI